MIPIQVETYRGARESAELGATLMHEHIFVRNPELELSVAFEEWQEEESIERAVASLTALRETGIETIVDMTVPGLGRDPGLVSRVASRIPLNVIASTGWYGAAVLPPFFQFRGPGRPLDGPDPLIEMFIGDIETGIGRTSIRAGMLKVTSSDGGITADEARTMTAAVVAAQHTGVAITTHSNPSLGTGREQQSFFRDHGLPLERLIIGHSGDTEDIDHLRELMDNGSTIGLDRFGMEHVLDDSRRIATLVALVSLGYAEHIVLSHDAAVFSHVTPPSWRSRAAPRWHMENIPRNILPALRKAGVSDVDIDQMMVHNPQRLLSRG